MKNLITLFLSLLLTAIGLCRASDSSAIMTSGNQTISTAGGSKRIDAVPLSGLIFDLSDVDLPGPPLDGVFGFVARGGGNDFAIGTGGDFSVWMVYNNGPVFGRAASGGMLFDHDGTDDPNNADMALYTDRIVPRLPIDLPERATPPAPPSDTARIFSRDNGGGKTQLCVIFPTGAVQVIATQP